MATTLLHLRSTTPGAVPTPEQLEVGEIAVNLVDKKWFTKKADGTVVCINQLTVLDGGEVGNSVVEPQGDPHFANVSLLLHFDGADGATTFTDSSTNNLTVTRSGDARITTSESKFGDASVVFDGSNDMLFASDAPVLDLETGDFTIELWFFLNQLNRQHTLAGKHSGTPAGTEWLLTVESTNRLKFQGPGSGSITQETSPLSANVWYHVAVTRHSDTLRMFLDGQQVTAYPNNSSPVPYTQNITGTGGFRVGAYQVYGSFVSVLNGYVDELRITKGIGRYTENFTPPAAPFPNE